MKPDLTISIISANNLDLLLACLHSVYDTTHNASLEVWVVDNASTDDTAAAVEAAFPEVKVIHNDTRQGFSTNNNVVLDKGRGRYLILLNDDTHVQDGALDQMIEFMDTEPGAGALGAFLLNPDGSFQPAFSRFPHPFIEALWPATNWSYRSGRHGTEPFEVDTVCGAAMMVRREILDQVGMLDTAFDPIYSEEVDWCYRIKQAGWRIYTLPRAQVVHYGSETMNRMMPRKYELLLSHKALFLRKHKGKGSANLYRAALSLSTAAKLVWWAIIASLPKYREASKEKMQLHWHILKRIPSL